MEDPSPDFFFGENNHFILFISFYSHSFFFATIPLETDPEDIRFCIYFTSNGVGVILPFHLFHYFRINLINCLFAISLRHAGQDEWVVSNNQPRIHVSQYE